MTDIAAATDAGDAAILRHDSDFRATKHWVPYALEIDSVGDITARLKALVDDSNLLLPDAGALLERIVVALLTGHVVLTGPPGTGKTTLAKLIATAFNCSANIETATADWTAYDVIGGLQPKVVGDEKFANEVLSPWLGHVTQAVVTCATAVALNTHDPETYPKQAHWLIIDEFSRAEIDKAIGPLYTALSGTDRRIPLWFGDAPERREVWVPERFRLLGTMNSVDTAYVFSFSQGLTRRFQFIYVGVPTPEQVDAEFEAAITQATVWYAIHYGSVDANDADGLQAHRDQFAEDANVQANLARFKSLTRFVRYAEGNRPGWPLGTAQVVDVIKQLIIRQRAKRTDASALDLAVADRVVPQMSGLTRDQIDALDTELSEGHLAVLTRTRAALLQIAESQSTHFS